MKLDVYRSCSRTEKREVLNAFWHSNVEAPSHIHEAAYQYGPYAVLCLVAVALELAAVILFSVHRVVVVGWVAGVVEACVVASLAWAIARSRAITREIRARHSST